ncbi:MAG: hypothetical protein WBG43_10630 [Marinifilaceae bacterium]
MMLFVPYAPANEILKFITVVLFSAIKFFVALPYSYAIGMSFWQAIITTCMGGLGGFFFFYYISGFLINFLIKRGLLKKKKRKRGKKIFSRKNKIIVKTRHTYGLIGIILLTPIILSLPVGAFLLRKYYKTNKWATPLMCISIILCSFITLTLLYFL